MQACPRCDSVMIKDERQTYTCTNCGVRVWADPIGCGLVRYNILPFNESAPITQEAFDALADYQSPPGVKIIKGCRPPHD